MATALTERLGIRHPIVLAPMGGFSGGRLAAAVSDAGGLGMIGTGYNDAAWIERERRRAPAWGSVSSPGTSPARPSGSRSRSRGGRQR